MKAIVERFFEALLHIPPEQFTTILDCVMWALKHELVQTSETGLDTLLSI